MQAKVREKEKAIALRKKGLSYNEILKQVPVAKSTLSEWLKDLSLTKNERQALKQRKSANITRGRIKAAAAHTANRKKREQELLTIAKKEYKAFCKDPLFKVGIGLYWAEGAKRNQYFAFSNSDVDMIIIVMRWMERFLGVSSMEIRPRLYIHRPYAHEGCERYWSEHIGIPVSRFDTTTYKPTSRLIKKRPQYQGVLRISVYRKELLLKTKFWIRMMVEEGFET